MKFVDLKRGFQLGTVEPADLEAFDPEDVAEVKREAGLIFRAGILRADVQDEERRIMRFVLSTEHVDRYGDIIRLRGAKRETREGDAVEGRGWILEHFVRAGSPFYLNHDRDQELGAWLRVAVDDTFEIGGKRGALIGDAEYLKAGVSALADVQWALASGKGLASGKKRPPATSVGFTPVEGKTYWPASEKERVELGLGRWGVEYLESELMEGSATKTPANPWAVPIGSPGEAEREVEAALDELVAAGTITKAAREVYVRAVPLGPDDARRRARDARRAMVLVPGTATATTNGSSGATFSITGPLRVTPATRAEGDADAMAAAYEVCLAKLRQGVELVDAGMASFGECMDELEKAAGTYEEPPDEDEPAEEGLDTAPAKAHHLAHLGTIGGQLADLRERLARIEAKVGAGGAGGAQAPNAETPKAVAGNSNVRGMGLIPRPRLVPK